MRASSGALAKVCQIKKFDMDDFLRANKIESKEVLFKNQNGDEITYNSYDTLEVIRKFSAYNNRNKKEEESRYVVTQDELDEIPF